MFRVFALGIASLLLGACVSLSSQADPTARDKLAAHAADPDAPVIVVPERLPERYGMLWANMYFPEGRPEDLPGVAVCVLPRGHEIVGRCVGTNDDSPWTAFEHDGYTVVLTTVSAPERREFLEPWLELDWTTDWRSVTWIDEPFGS